MAGLQSNSWDFGKESLTTWKPVKTSGNSNLGIKLLLVGELACPLLHAVCCSVGKH